jgi:hypothetical protein
VLNHEGSKLLEFIEDHLVCLGSGLEVIILEILTSVEGWNIPEANVGSLCLNCELPLLWVSLDQTCDLLGLVVSVVGLLGVSLNTVSLEAHPKLEGIILSTASESLVTEIVVRVFTLMEEVGSTGVV